MSGQGAPSIDIRGAEDLRVAVVASSWHTVVMDGLVEGARAALGEAGITAEVTRVPGSFELPVVAAALAHGLAHHDAGRPTEALWWWQYSYLADWGDRAAMAVRVLQTLLAHIRLDADADVVGEAEFDALHS